MRHFALGSVLLLASAHHALAAVLNVVVGGPGGNLFNPQTVNATTGDIVRFTFQQKNHTVTQSSLESPCQPLRGGFNSGFVPVAADKTSDFPIAELPVTNSEPIWAYCRQGPHCTSGMVFAVNPRDQFPAFQAAARGASSSVPPVVSSTSTSTSASVPVPSSKDHKVIVGGPGTLAFTPSNITAQAGDTITFEFRQKNHTVTASSFEDPCRASGFDSGYRAVGDGASNFPTYTVQVNDTKPIWAFCRQGTHCTSGMVFAVNADESSAKNFAAFRTLAMQGNGGNSTSGYPSPSAAWRPAIGSSSIAVALGLSAAALLL
jgi:plastocyanin